MVKHKIHFLYLLVFFSISIAGCKKEKVQYLIVGGEPIPFGYQFAESAQIPYNWVSWDSKIYNSDDDFLFKIENDSTEIPSHPLVYVTIKDGIVSEVQVLVRLDNYQNAIIGCEGRRFLLSGFNFSDQPENNFYNNFFVSKLNDKGYNGYKIVRK